MIMSRSHGRWLAGMLLLLAATPALWAADPPAKEPAAAVPPWQRLLRDEDERRAKQLQEQVDKHWEAAEFEQALKSAKALAALRQTVQGADHWQTVNARWRVKALERIGQQEAALQKQVAQAPALWRQAGALEGKGRAREALPLRQQILDLYRKLLTDDHPSTATSYGNLANNQYAQGKYAEAERNHQRALELFRKLLTDDHPDTAASYSNLALNQKAQGKYAEAEKNHLRALELFRKLLTDDHPDTAHSYNNLAANQNAQGKYAEAEASLSKAAELLERTRLWAASSGLERAGARDSSPLVLLAAVLARNGKHQTAWERFEQGLGRGTWDDLDQRRRLTQEEVSRRAQLRQQMARLDRHLEQVLAVKDADQRKRRLEEVSAQRLRTQQALEQLAHDLEHKHGPAAGQIYDRATIQQALPTAAAILGWVDTAAAPHAADPNGEHWAVLLRSRGEPVWVSLPGSGPNHAWTKADFTLAADLREALTQPRTNDWQALAQKLQGQRLGPVIPHLGARDGLPAVRHLIVLPSTYLKDVPVEVLAPKEYTVSYAPSGTLFAYLQKQEPPASRSLLALADPVFRQPGADSPARPLPPGGLLVNVVTPGSTAAKAELRSGDVLLRYAATDLKTVDDLKGAIQAHLQDRDVPLSVWRNGEPLSTRAQPGPLGVVLTQEPAPVALAKRRQEEKEVALARSQDRGVEDLTDLPGTRVEVEELRRLFARQGRAVRLLADSAASEQALGQMSRAGELKDYRFLHLATHGQLNDQFALRSKLFLSLDNLPDADEQMRKGEPLYDGELTAAEVLLSWKLDAELVTLSACETALGKYEVGESYIGFPQAFLLSGARSVCVSLWRVNDTATALLMTRFYQNLLGAREGLKAPLSKAEALKEAKTWLRTLKREEVLRLAAKATNGVERGTGRKALPPPPDLPKPEAGAKEDCPYAHPYYWSGFILIGHPH